MCGRSVMVMVMVMIQTVGARIYSDCEPVSSTPAHCQEVRVSHLYGYREPLQHHTTCPDNVMEVEFVLTPPSHTGVSAVRLELGTLDINNTPVAWIDFERYPNSSGVVNEWLWFRCVPDHYSRVVTPWSNTTSHTNITILIQVTKWWVKVYQKLEGEQRLVADQQCPYGVKVFPYNKMRVWCLHEGDCGKVQLLPNIPEYTEIPSLYWESLDVAVTGGEGQETSLTFKGLPRLHHWSIRLQYYSDGYDGASVIISHTPNRTIREFVWLEVACDRFPPDSTLVQLYNDIPSSTAPPRCYILLVGIDWMRVTETTPGHNSTTHQYNCSHAFLHHPNLTITLTCYEPGYWGKTLACGRLSQSCPTELEQDRTSKVICKQRPIVEDLLLPRCVVQMVAVMTLFLSVLMVIMLFTWIQFVDTDIVQYLAPLCRRLAL